MKWRSRFSLAVWLYVIGLGVSLSAGAGSGPRVVVSIKPIHSFMAGLMEGIGEPELLVTGTGSPLDID